MKPCTVFLPLFIGFVFYQTVHAQWTNTGGAPSRLINCFAVKDSTIIAGTDGGSVRSKNNGTSWVNVGITYTSVRALLFVESYPFNIVAGTLNGSTFMSSDTGSTFDGFPISANQIGGLAHVNSILMNDPKFYVGTEKGIYLLTHYYPLESWIQYDDGLPSVETKVRAVIGKDGEVYAGTNGGVFKLNGSTWNEKNTGLTGVNVTALGSTDGYLIAGIANVTGEGIYISTDNGDNWALSQSIASITSILTVGPNIFVGSFGDGVWLTKNYGASWQQVNTGFGGSAYYVQSLGANDQYIFAGTNNANIWRRPLSQLVTVLPIELTSFICIKNSKGVDLYWNTATEMNNAGFEIQKQQNFKSSDVQNANWQKIGFIEGAGNSNSPKAYGFLDHNLHSGYYSYRLKQIDRDGAFKYSHTVDAVINEVPAVFDLLQNYPNPFNPTTTIGFTLENDGMTTLKIYNVLGVEVATLVNEELKAGEYHKAVFDAHNTATGVYFACLKNGKNVQFKKMLIVK